MTAFSLALLKFFQKDDADDDDEDKTSEGRRKCILHLSLSLSRSLYLD